MVVTPVKPAPAGKPASVANSSAAAKDDPFDAVKKLESKIKAV